MLAQLRAIYELNRRRANDFSTTIAILATAFAEPNTRYTDLLPYPPKRYLEADTVAILSRLLAEGKVPRKVVSILGSVGILKEILGGKN